MINELKDLGLSSYEAKIIETLSKEKLELRDLSEKAEVPFGKVYSIVKGLMEKRIVKETESRPKLVYIEDISEVISRLIKEKQEKDKDMYEKLRDITSGLEVDKRKNPKFFEIGVTAEDNKRIQLRSFQEAEEEVLQILNIHHKPRSNREAKTIWEIEIEKAVNRGVEFKSIYPVDSVLPQVLLSLNKKNPKGFDIRRYDTDFVRCDIIDRKKVLLKLVQQDPLMFGGIIFIENEKLAENLIKIFTEMWRSGN